MKVVYISIVIIVIIVVYYLIYKNLSEYKEKYEKMIMTLYRQSARWAIASAQDDSELIRNLHANYATGYLWALKDVISTEEFKTITGEDFQILEEKIVSIQDKAAKMLVDKCKDLLYIKDPTILSAIYSKAD